MKTFKDYKIGDAIIHGPGYDLKCCNRFGNIINSIGKTVGRCTVPSPLFEIGSGFVIGCRLAIMSDYKYVPGSTFQGFEDSFPEHEPAYASGKKEMCLILVPNYRKFKPYLVRLKDIFNK